MEEEYSVEYANTTFFGNYRTTIDKMKQISMETCTIVDFIITAAT